MKAIEINFIFSLTLMTLAQVKGNMFTAIAKLEPLLDTENQLLFNIKEYVRHEGQRLRDIERLIGQIEQERVNPSFKNASVNLEHPIQSFLLVRRLRRQWFTMKRYVSLTDYQEEYIDKAEEYEQSKYQYPSEKDYDGSVNALLRLQETYELQTASIADGNLLRQHSSPPLLADDCFEIGKITKDKNKDRYLEWTQEAKQKRMKGLPNLYTEIQVLEQLADAYFKKREYSKALETINQIIKIDPNNTFATKHKKSYERSLKFQQLNDESNAEEDARYMALCRGDEAAYGHHKNPGELRCRYAHYNRPRLFIRPAKEEILFSEPRIIFYHDIVTDKEINTIKQRALPHLTRSQIKGFGESHGRISSQTWLDIFKSDDPLGKILPRIQDYTGLSTKRNHAELLQVLNYGLGGHYHYHYDDETDGVSEGFQGMGKRIATVLIYLSDVEAGGATVFSKAGARVPPIKGGAVMWYNYLKNGDRDLKTRHAGCPVLMGSKWASNLWIREFGQVFRRRCGLTRDDKY